MATQVIATCCKKGISSCNKMIAAYFIVVCIISILLNPVKAICPPIIASMGHFGGAKSRLMSKEIRVKGDVDKSDNSKDSTQYSSPGNSTMIDLLASIADITSNSAVVVTDQLTYMQTMTAGALSRTMAQTLMHPANTYKTLLQIKGSDKAGGILAKLTPERLLRGVDAQFLMSLPHGAFYFFVIDQVKTKLSGVLSSKFDFLQDFAASTISTVFCSIVSTPQMVLTDRLMAGVYPTSMDALKSILSTEGIAGFYTGWWPALAQKIPSYG